MAGIEPTKYFLDTLTLVNNSGEQFDIRNLLMECKIFESITSNFLLGEIALQDATDFINNAKIVGQESLRIRFRHPGAEHNDDIIDKIFRVYKLSGVGRAGHNTTMFKLNFCSPEFLHSKRVRISQAFSGSYSDIAGQIARDHLGLRAVEAAPETGWPKNEGPYWEVREPSSDESGNVIIPNWTVNYAINWLCSKAQGKQVDSGIQDSFFFYETANGGYKLEPITSMLKTQYLSGGEFSYSPAAEATSDNWNSPFSSGRRILTYNMGSTANVLEATIKGMFASKQTTIDTHKKNYKERDYNYLEDFYAAQNKKQAELTQLGLDAPEAPGDQKHPLIWKEPDVVYNASGVLGLDDSGSLSCTPFNNLAMEKDFDKTLGDFPTAHTILASKNSFVHDSEGILKSVSEKGIEDGVIQFRTAVKQLLKYHTMNVLISTRTDIQTGQMINLVIPPTRPAAAKSRDSFLHSGKYLITEIMWDLTLKQCKTNLKVIKDSYHNELEMYEADVDILREVST